MGVNKADVAKLEMYLNTIKKKAEKEFVGKIGGEAQKSIKADANFKGHVDSKGNFIRPTGATKESIKLTGDSGDSIDLVVGTPYSKYLELGTRNNVPQPFVKYTLEKMKSLVTKGADEVMRG